MNSTPPLDGALADLRVLDLAGAPGLFAGRMLGEFGADVIRIEPPGGDDVRGRRPFLADEPGPDRSLYHQHFNMNKRGITLDLTQSEGQELFKRLVATADVLIETGAPGDMAALGLDYTTLQAINPRLIYVTITPFGQEGPMSGYAANDLVAMAMSGVMALNGFPGDPPNVPGAEQAYHMASVVAVSGTLLALTGRDRSASGAGKRVDVSIQESASMATVQTANANYYNWYQQTVKRRGLETASGGRSFFECRDGRWISFVVPPTGWDAFLKWLGDEDVEHALAGDEWRDQRHRVQHGAEIAEATQRLVSRLDRDAVFHEGQRRHLLTMPVNDVSDLVSDAHLRDRDYFVEVANPVLESALIDVGVPYKMSRTPADIHCPAPRVGQHNGDVYGGLLGMSQETIESLIERGVV